jgi:Zn-dependent protease
MDQLLDPNRLPSALLGLVALILSIAVHEFGHAFVADRLGDPLPRSQGRVTLNPIAHIDPIGTLLFPFIGAMTGMRLLGWGKPVQIALHPRWIRRGLSLKSAHFLISVAGPAMNIAFALVLSLVFVILARTDQLDLAEVVMGVVTMNIGLCFFNLIPCPPLDGRAVLFWFLPTGSPVEEFLNRYGMFIFFAMFVLPMPGGHGRLLDAVLIPARHVAQFWIGHLVAWTQ